MCGIAGLVGPGANDHADRVASMVAALRHRGPDDDGLVVYDRAVLGSARLSIIDPAGGHQPMRSPDGRTAMVCNGEIYGHRRLRELHTSYPFRTGSDCEVILPLHAAHGSDLLRHLPGTFSLAVWDDRAGTLLLARDRFGERPLYYATTPDGLLAFASESRALLASGLFAPRPDLDAVASMLRQGYVPPTMSIWSGIHSLPHASRLVVTSPGSPQVDRWWSAPPVGPDIPVEEAAAWFRMELDRAVQDQLEADVPIGAFLSGGVDSTTIAALAARHHPDLHAFTFDMPGESELAYATESAARHGITLHVCRPDTTDMAQQILDVAEVWDEPFGDSSAVPTHQLCGFAREHVKTVLTGDGADELLGGYLVWARWHLRDAGTDVARVYASFRQYFDPAELAALGLPGVGPDDVDVSSYRYGTPDDVSRFDLDHYLPGDILVKTDRASMSHGLEVRSPFLDVAVAEGCLALPAHHKVDEAQEKLLLRRAFADLWPASVAGRQKQGFGAPMSAWLALPDVAELKHAHLVDTSSALFELVDPAAVAPFVHANDQRTWNLLMLAIWWTRSRREPVAR